MTEKNVQLKRDDVVGNEIVSENINPKTDTNSINDIINGLPLSETQRIMWNAINNQLSRIVNSWNGRTGVVVATKEDVGLGNVDNLSFDDILKRLEDLMMETFGKKRMRLFNNLHEVDRFCDQHNKEKDYVVAGSSFFSINGYNLDRKSYIGYIFLNEDDPDNLILEHTQLHINLSGWADMSMRWDKEWGVRIKCKLCENIMDWDGKPHTEPKKCDRPGCSGINDEDNTDLIPFTDESNTGRLGVNIAKQERYLEVYKPVYVPGTILDEIDKDQGGLRIRPGSLYGRFHYFTGMYGDRSTSNGTVVAGSSLLVTTTDVTTETQGEEVTIILQNLDIDDNHSTPVSIKARLHPDWLWRDYHDPINPNRNPMDYPPHLDTEDPARVVGLREGDKIFVSMRDYRTGTPPIPPTDMDSRLMFRNDHIGIVTSAPSTWNPTAPYIITLNRIRAKVGWGLQHLNDRNSPQDSFITIRLAKGEVVSNIYANLSGLQVIKGRNDPDITGFNTTSEVDERFRTINLPTGPKMVFDRSPGGLYINPDASLMIAPYRHYKGTVLSNWNVSVPGDKDYTDNDTTSRHALEENSYVGINTTKIVANDKVGNASGLRVIQSGTALDMQSFYGVRSTDNHQSINFTTLHSGGVSINVGNFLEISPPKYDETDPTKFIDRGKVNIRVNQDMGLHTPGDTETTNNRLALKINVNRGVRFNTCQPNNGAPLAANTITEGIQNINSVRGQLEVHILGDKFRDPYTTINPLQTPNDGGLRFDNRTGTDKGSIFVCPKWMTEQLSQYTGRGIIIRNHNTTSGEGSEFRIETRLVGQGHTTGNNVAKSLGLQYENDVTTDNDGIRVRPWNGIMTNNNEGTTSAQVYTHAHHGVMVNMDPKSALIFRPTTSLDGSGSAVANGQRTITINIGQNRGTNMTNRKRQGLHFEDGIPKGTGQFPDRHNTGTDSGWSTDESTKLRVWDNTFRGLEFRTDSTLFLGSLASQTNTGNITKEVITINPTTSAIIRNTVNAHTPARQINPPMDPNEIDLAGMLQIKRHGGLRFRFRGDTWAGTTKNSWQVENSTPNNQQPHHGRLEAQVNRARGMEIATSNITSTAPSATNIYPTSGANAGDLQLRINEKTALRFTSDRVNHHNPNCVENGCGDIHLISETRNPFVTPTVYIPEQRIRADASLNVTAFSSNDPVPNMTITPALPVGTVVTFPTHTITMSSYLVIPIRTITFSNTNITIPQRPVAISRNTAELQPVDVNVPSRTVTVTRPNPILDDDSPKPITPFTLTPVADRNTTLVNQTLTFKRTSIPHTQFTEDDRIIVLPEIQEFLEKLPITGQTVSIPSYQTMLTWKAIGSNGTEYTITRPVDVAARTVNIPDRDVDINTFLDMYQSGDVFIRIPESDQFGRDQGKVRLIIDPNQGLGFVSENVTTSATITTNGSNNPHNWELEPTRRDPGALRIKLNTDKGVKFRTGTDATNITTTKPKNTYNLTGSSNDAVNGSGQNGQIEIHILGQNPGNPATINDNPGGNGSTDGGLKFDNRSGSTKGSMFIDSNWVTRNLKINRGLTIDPNGRLEAFIDRGLEFIGDPDATNYSGNSALDKRMRAKRWFWEFNTIGGEEIHEVEPGTYEVECHGGQGGGYHGGYGTTKGYFSGGKGTYIKGRFTFASKQNVYVGVGECPQASRGGWPNGGDTGMGSLVNGSPTYFMDDTNGGYGGGGCSYVSLFPRLYDSSPNAPVPYLFDATVNAYDFLEFAAVMEDSSQTAAEFNVDLQNTHLQRTWDRVNGDGSNFDFGRLNIGNLRCISIHLARKRGNSIQIFNEYGAKLIAGGSTYTGNGVSESGYLSTDANGYVFKNLGFLLNDMDKITRENMPLSFGDFWTPSGSVYSEDANNYPANGTIQVKIPYGTGQNQIMAGDMIGFVYINWGAKAYRNLGSNLSAKKVEIKYLPQPAHETTIYADQWGIYGFNPITGNVIGFLAKHINGNIITVSAIPKPTELFGDNERPFIIGAGGGGASAFSKGYAENENTSFNSSLKGSGMSTGMAETKRGAGGSGIEGGNSATSDTSGGYSGRSGIAGTAISGEYSIPISSSLPSTKGVTRITSSGSSDIKRNNRFGNGFVRITRLY